MSKPGAREKLMLGCVVFGLVAVFAQLVLIQLRGARAEVGITSWPQRAVALKEHLAHYIARHL
jgi:hypothetical protein